MSENMKKSTNESVNRARLVIGIGIIVALLAFCATAVVFYISYTGGLDEYRVSPDSEREAVLNADDRVPTGEIDVIPSSSLRYVEGTGDVTYIEYTDLECPFCKDYHPIVRKVMPDYDGRVAYTVKHFPLHVHSKALREAGAAECAGQQGKFFEYIDEIFAITPSNNRLEDGKLFKVAEDLGLDIDTFTSCLENEEYKEFVAEDALEAMSLGAEGTPHSALIDKDGNVLLVIQGSLTEQALRKALDDVLESVE